jgi:hypothetical protein
MELSQAGGMRQRIARIAWFGDLMTQNSSNSGKISQSLNYATINLSNSQNTNPSPTLKTTGGIVVGVSNLPGNGTSNASGGPLAHI